MQRARPTVLTISPSPWMAANGRATTEGRGRPSALVVQLRVPVAAAAFGSGVQHHPQRGRVGRAAGVLAGVGGGAAHLAGPEVADGPVTPGEDVEGGDLRAVGQHAEIVARVAVVEIPPEKPVPPVPLAL